MIRKDPRAWQIPAPGGESATQGENPGEFDAEVQRGREGCRSWGGGEGKGEVRAMASASVRIRERAAGRRGGALDTLRSGEVLCQVQ